jgi:hypothetical protein
MRRRIGGSPVCRPARRSSGCGKNSKPFRKTEEPCALLVRPLPSLDLARVRTGQVPCAPPCADATLAP